jgi:endo-1,4-beta-xylanase
MGVAVSPRALKGEEAGLILKHFSSVTPENAMKMGPIHPNENQVKGSNINTIIIQQMIETHS